jgi:hypothetical protein
MKTFRDQVSVRFRSADPARAVPPFGRDEVDRGWQQIVDRLQVGSDVELVEPARSNRSRWPAVVTSMAFVAAVSVAIVLLGGQDSPTSLAQHPGSLPGSTTADQTAPPASFYPSWGPQGTIGSSTDTHFVSTLAEVERVQTLLTAPETAASVSEPPAPTLQIPPSFAGSPNLVDRARFWTATISRSDAIAYFRSDPVSGFALSGSGTGSNDNGGTAQIDWLTFAKPGSTSNDPTIEISVVTTSSGVAIRGDVMAIWIPTKSSSELIGSVDSVDVVVNRVPRGSLTPTAPTVERTLTGSAAQELAAAVDALPVASSPIHSCLAGSGFTDRLTFHGAARTIVVLVQVSGCMRPAILVDNVTEPDLEGDLDPIILQTLGLPASYGE